MATFLPLARLETRFLLCLLTLLPCFGGAFTALAELPAIQDRDQLLHNDSRSSDGFRIRQINEIGSSTFPATELQSTLEAFGGVVMPDQIVYQNTCNLSQSPVNYLAPGTGVLMLDDFFLTDCGRLFRPSACVFSPPGTSRFNVIMMYWFVDERNLLSPIPDTRCEVRGIPAGSVYDPGPECHYSAMARSRLPRSLWLGIQFSTDEAGWVLGEQAEIGTTEDEFLICSGTDCAGFVIPGHWAGFGGGVRAVVDSMAANDSCTTPRAVTNGEVSLSTCRSTTDGPVHQSCLPSPPYNEEEQQIYNDRWFAYQAPCGGHATISVCEGNFDTLIAVYEGRDCQNIETRRKSCNNDSGVCGEDSLRSSVTVPVVCGEDYLIRVGGFLDQMGDAVLAIKCVGDSCQTVCGDRNVCTSGQLRGDVCCFTGIAGCDDCNLDQVADTGGPVQGCAQFVGQCAGDPSWDCAANWSPAASYPGDGAAAGLVSLGVGDVVTLNVDSTLERIRMAGGSQLEVTPGDLTLAATGISGFVGGRLLIDGGHELMSESGDLWIAAGGFLSSLPPGNTQASGAILSGWISVDAGNPRNCSSVTCGGVVWMSGTMSLTVLSDVLLTAVARATSTPSTHVSRTAFMTVSARPPLSL
ncbi:MAG: hypothetical protein ACKVT0_03980 [Planctomycetaceae bacterium]